jgi:hypothetical protein
MDPFFALVQALACAAHLATPNQYERFRRHVFRGRFREPADAPQLDVYMLFVDDGPARRCRAGVAQDPPDEDRRGGVKRTPR